jgi:small subunit ribosomal protein S6
MVNYEFIAIINPTISEEEKNTLMDSLKKNIEENSAKIEKEDIWGEKKMAYKINKSDI